jgi:hypothetical protein
VLRYEVNLEVIVTFGMRLTWVITHRTRLESAPSHPGHPGGDNLLLESAGFSLFVLIDLTLESLDLACPFSETNRVRLGYIECPSTSCRVHEEKGWEVVRVVADGGATSDFPQFPNRAIVGGEPFSSVKGALTTADVWEFAASRYAFTRTKATLRLTTTG